MKHFTVGLRTRVLLLVLFPVIPALGLMGYTAVSQRHQATKQAEREAMSVVRVATREQDQFIAATQQLLYTLSQLPVVKQLSNAAACSRTLVESQKPYRYFANLGVAALDGRVICSAQPLARPVNIADRSYFQRALQSRGFGIGDYQVGRITGINAINFGYPVSDAGGKIRAVVYASINLSWLNQLIARIEMPQDSTVTVIDGHGTILARSPDPRLWVGKSIHATPLASVVLAHQREGMAELEGVDGITRLYAFAPLRNSPSSDVYMIVGIPKAVALAAANGDFVRNLALLFLVAAVALILAWVGSDLLVLRRIQALAGAARRLGQGDLSVRTGLPHGTEELGQLARGFDAMASALQRVNRALKTLSAANRAVVRAGNEQTLMAEMCRIVVEVGGYRLAWVGYAEQNPGKSVRPVAQAGIEAGYLATLDLTWADTGRGRGPTGTAIRTGKPTISWNVLTDPAFAPWREEALKRGFASTIALPLRVDGEVIGALSIYAEEPDVFVKEEVELLLEMASDLAYGIAAQRTRTEREQAHDTIRRMAYHDALTDLPSHMYFENRLQLALAEAQAGNQSLAVFLLDLNRLRDINDALGFHQGDLLLKDVGRRIRQELKGDELVARMHGDEFAILLPASDATYATEVVQRVLEALKAPFVLNGFDLDVSATVGITLFPRHGEKSPQLIRHAHVAMRQARKSGKHYAIYAAAQDENSRRRLTLGGELRRAIEKDELSLHYHPKIDMRAGQVCGVEALARWPHPQRGMIPTDEFIALAEHTGLIKPLTDWVVEAALRQSSVWRETGLVLPVAVNLSVHNLRDADLLNKMQRLLREGNAGAGWLELEITESAVMEDPAIALEILKRLRDLHFTLFIDDFGTGHSSLGYLKKLPVDSVKIDKSFVIDMQANKDSETIVRSTVTLAHDLGLKVVAEGVESQTTWDQLAALGCDVAQGYHISKPLPAEKFKEWMDQYTRNSKVG